MTLIYRKLIKELIILLIIFYAGLSMASIGEVDQVEGKGVIDRNNNDIFIEQELEVEQYDTVKTGNGKVGILFVDDTRVDVTQHSKLVIDEFVYDPNTKKGKLNLSAKLVLLEMPDLILLDLPHFQHLSHLPNNYHLHHNLVIV